MTRRVIAGSAVAILGIATALAPGGSASAVSGGVHLGLVKSLDVTNKGLIVFAESGGANVSVKSWDPAHPNTPPVVLVGGLPAGSANAATNDHKSIWVVYGGSDPEDTNSSAESASAWYIPFKGKAKRVLDVAKFQTQHSLDPYDIDDPPNPGESNPYDVEVLPDNSALIADAAGDDLLRVTPDGRAWTVACFPDKLESTKNVPPDALPPGVTLPPMIPAEAVPTGVALDGHGNAYVSLLTGFPFAYGASYVVRVSVDARNAGCNGTPAHPVLPGPIAASGFTGIDDVWVGLDGAVYVTELDKLGIFHLEGAFANPASAAGKGRVTRVKAGSRTEIAANTLTAPGAAVLGKDGHVYVTDLSLLGAVLKQIS